MQNQKEWLNLHANIKHQPKYPSSDVVSFVFKNFKKGSTILDLGCGAGRHLKFLAENGFECYGVDYSENGVKASELLLLEHKLKANLQVASAHKLPFESEFFDGILCYGILLYNPKELIEEAIKEMYRVLKKGSKVYLHLRGTEDYRFVNGEKLNEYEAIVKETNPNRPAYGENGMKMYFVDEKEIKRMFADFKITINHHKLYFDNYAYNDDNFFIILEK